MAMECQENDRNMERMARVLRHRLRNIASGIRSAVQLVDEETVGVIRPEFREYFPLIQNECEDLCEVANRCSLFFDHTLPLPPPEEASKLTLRVLTELSARFPDVEIRQEGVAEGVVPGWIGNALHDVACNACEAAPRGIVDVRIHRTGSGLSWTVSDSGPGVEPDVRDSLFLPFFTTRPRHLGLGLPLARRLCQAVGGCCEVEHEPGCPNAWIVKMTTPGSSK